MMHAASPHANAAPSPHQAMRPPPPGMNGNAIQRSVTPQQQYPQGVPPQSPVHAQQLQQQQQQQQAFLRQAGAAPPQSPGQGGMSQQQQAVHQQQLMAAQMQQQRQQQQEQQQMQMQFQQQANAAYSGLGIGDVVPHLIQQSAQGLGLVGREVESMSGDEKVGWSYGAMLILGATYPAISSSSGRVPPTTGSERSSGFTAYFSCSSSGSGSNASEYAQPA